MISVKIIQRYAPASSLFLSSEGPLAELSFTEWRKEREGSKNGEKQLRMEKRSYTPGEVVIIEYSCPEPLHCTTMFIGHLWIWAACSPAYISTTHPVLMAELCWPPERSTLEGRRLLFSDPAPVVTNFSFRV